MALTSTTYPLSLSPFSSSIIIAYWMLNGENKTQRVLYFLYIINNSFFSLNILILKKKIFKIILKTYFPKKLKLIF